MPAANPILGLIVSTNASCKIDGQSCPGLPTIVWPEGIDELASDWLRNLVTQNGVAISSAHTYASALLPFIRFRKERKLAWHEVDDNFLLIWRSHLKRKLKLRNNRINTSLKTVFSFYRWAEEEKLLKFHVGIYSPSDVPDDLRGVDFPISAKNIAFRGRHGSQTGWTTPLLLTSDGKGSTMRHTPTESEVENLHNLASQRLHGVRDSLMLSWAEECGARRAEFMSLTKAQLPGPAELAELIEKDEPWVVLLTRKGGSKKPLNVPVDLLIHTLDFIDIERRAIVQHCQKSIVGYREPPEVFLSSTTGLALHLDSVTALAGKMFRKVGIRKANIHRLRARFAVSTVETLVEAVFAGRMIGPDSSWIETILVMAAEAMGHANPASLRPYLNLVLNRRIAEAESTKNAKMATRLRLLLVQESTVVRRLGDMKDLQRAASSIKAGNKSEAASILRKIADEL